MCKLYSRRIYVLTRHSEGGVSRQNKYRLGWEGKEKHLLSYVLKIHFMHLSWVFILFPIPSLFQIIHRTRSGQIWADR